MDGLNTDKANYLMRALPPGVILTSKWLGANGYYKQLVKQLCDRQWLERVGNGAYVRLNDELTWQGAVVALQSQLNQSVHVGGITALQMHGILQYVPMRSENPTFYLYNDASERSYLPRWFQRSFTQCQFQQHQLFDDVAGLLDMTWGKLMLRTSAPERALLEMLALVPEKTTFSHASELFESINEPRTSLVQLLLERCKVIKAKRLFLYFLEAYGLHVLNELDLERIDLGTSKFVVGEGGKYSNRWKISVPRLYGDLEGFDG